MPKGPKHVDALTHDHARRRNNPTAELQSLAEQQEEISPRGPVRFARARPLAPGETRDRDPDLDPQIVWNGARIRLTREQVEQLAATGEVEIGDAQLVWRGKDSQDWSDLVVNPPMLYVQEKIHPKAIIDDLKRRARSPAKPSPLVGEGGPPALPEGRERDAQADSPDTPSPGSLRSPPSPARGEGALRQPDLFADFNGLADPEARAEFYQHGLHWSNRMILGDSLQVMASLAEREALRGKVQCIYFDPPYGIKFNSNWQVSTLSRDVKDGKQADVTREPEQVKAFRDTWKDGIHSYLTYLRDRLTVARELLTESGSIFVQIGDENVHRVRAVMDEVFGAENFASLVTVRKTTSEGSTLLGATTDFVIWYCKHREMAKFRVLYQPRSDEAESRYGQVYQDGRRYQADNITSSRSAGDGDVTSFHYQGRSYSPGKGTFKTTKQGLDQLAKADRFDLTGRGMLRYRRFANDFGFSPVANLWSDISGAVQSRSDPKVYVVQTSTSIIARCILMTTDPGDLVLDPTCGSGTTATVAEQWGRRWITVDTSRVALALARTRLMAARYPYYLLADSPEGQRKEWEVSGRPPSPLWGGAGGGVAPTLQDTNGQPTPSNPLPDPPPQGGREHPPARQADVRAPDIRLGFVYERAPHITLKSIANNAEIDVIWETWQRKLEPLRSELNAALGRVSPSSFETPPGAAPQDEGFAGAPSSPHPEVRAKRASKDEGKPWQEWEIPREASASWPEPARKAHAAWWEARIARQKEIDASIAKAADVELLYDRPYEDKGRVRVAGPFTVESLSPHRVVTSRDDTLGDELAAAGQLYGDGAFQRGPSSVPPPDFGAMVLENLRAAGVQQKDKAGAIRFSSLEPWPGEWIAAEGRYPDDSGRERRAGIFIGPEFGTVTRADLTAAAREASEARFDVLIACAFSYDAHASELSRLGPLAILKARMNPDLHMADELKTTGKGNLFVVFGEPDIDIVDEPDGMIRVKVNGVDVFDPATGEIRSDDTRGIACWFIDTEYNEESFFVRHAYFLGANDPYKSLKTALRAEIDEDAWATLYRDTSRPFARPETGRIAVKVINHFGDEVLKVFGV